MCGGGGTKSCGGRDKKKETRSGGGDGVETKRRHGVCVWGGGETKKRQ